MNFKRRSNAMKLSEGKTEETKIDVAYYTLYYEILSRRVFTLPSFIDVAFND
jgi:hypothetical protein